MKSSDSQRRNQETLGEEKRYHLRSRTVTSNIREVNMADNNSEGVSNCGDEMDHTVVQQDSTIEELREQIKTLQASLAASEQERLQLRNETYRQVAEVNAAEATAASFKNGEDSTISFASHARVAASNPHLGSQGAYDDPNSATPASANTLGTAAGVNYTNATSANGMPSTHGNCAHGNCTQTPYFPIQQSQKPAATRQITNLPASITSSLNTNMSQVYTPNVSTASMLNTAPLISTPGYYPQTHTRKVLDLPEFHGSPEEWPMFSVAYRETTNVYFYTNLENLLRLQKALKGKARQQVESLLIHPNSVGAVMKTLEFHYGRPDLLIRSQISKARSFPAVTGGRTAEILNFSALVSNLTTFLENASALPHLNNPTLLDELVCKLPMNKREEWYRHIFNIQKPYPTVRDFSDWLQQIAAYVSMSTDVMPSRNPTNDQANRKAKNLSNPVMTAINDEKSCSMCKQNHHLYKCQKFKDIDYSNRWNFVKTNRLCFCCLEPGHNLQQCNKRRACNIISCNKFHNRLLHKGNEDTKGNTTSEGTSVVTVSDCQTVRKHSAKQSKQRSQTLLKYLPVKLKGPKGEISVIAFIDEGAKVSLLEESVANAIGLKGKVDTLRLKWIGNHTTSEHSRQVSLEIAGDFKAAEFHHMKGVRTTKQLYLPQQTLKLRELMQMHTELTDICICEYHNAIPRILIGMPHSNLTRTIKAVNFDDGFAVHKTNLGWTVFGSNEENFSDDTVCHVDIETYKTFEVNKQIAEYFAAENLEIKQLPIIKSNADKRAQKLLEETTKYKFGRYETGLLWCTDNIKFPESFSIAVKRLEQVEEKMARNAVYADWYNNKIQEYVSKSYARKLAPHEEKDDDPRIWYLPHFATSNPNKGNKRRLVFDAAAKINEISLNSVLTKGPDEYQPKPLLSILFKFRQGQVGVCGDIREMFHRICIRKEDQNSQRFLWRGGDRHKKPDVYVMCAMIFGSVSSPCSAQFIKNLHAEKFRDISPRAVDAIVERHYVDDYMDSFHTTQEGISVTKQVVGIHSSAGFELRGIISNSIELMEAVAGNAAPLPKTHNPCRYECVSEKVLGMHWNPKEDYLFFKLLFAKVSTSVLDGSRRPTKGEILSVVMSIFDPIGFLCSAVLRAKILMQRLWQRKVEWHAPIPNDIHVRWLEWYRSLKRTEGLLIPRCYSPNFLQPGADVQLHIFVDASELAFAAVAFWRIDYESSVEVSFIAGRSRCSPVKMISIPRLELQSATLGVRLKEAVINGHDVKPSSVTFWSDSKTVIQWLKSDARRYKQFVAHRITEILQSSDESQWRWIPGKDNPADDATRIKDFTLKGKWLNGPSFLKLGKDKWPTLAGAPNSEACKEEERSKQLYSTLETDEALPFHKYSNYYKFLKIMSWVLLAVRRFRKKSDVIPKLLNASNIKAAEILTCRLVQEAEFSCERNALQNGQLVAKSSSLYKLSPVLDDEGIIRLSGRIDYAECVPTSTKRPIILPKNHALSRLIVRHFHELYYHHNFEATICAIRYKFWIPNVRRLLSSVKTNCQQCKNSSSTPETPLMGQLPIDRLTPFVRPFSYTGVDYFGPVLVAIGRRQEKRWVAIFTCLTIRAIHLELARDLSADSTILVCRNFINRRGVPARMRSDRGTNFIGASKEEWVSVQHGLTSECNRRGVEWIFNTPANPSAGGIWERMVRAVKKVLAFTLKERAPQIETLQSLLIEAENLVNSRPLTHVPIESTDAEPLTPNHFLLGGPNFAPTEAVPEKACLRKQWQIAQQLKQTFWRRWMLEYLPTLTRRTKWHKKVKPIIVGDVVVVCDDNESRGMWKRGIVIEAKPAADGQVRSVLVRTTSGNLRRPASKIAVLDVIGDSLDRDPNHGGENVTA